MIGEDPEIVASQPPLRNSPRLAEFEDEDGASTFFIFVEQSTLSTLSEALYIWFCTHYIFHRSSTAEVYLFSGVSFWTSSGGRVPKHGH